MTMRCRASSIVVTIALLIVLLDGAIGKLRVVYRWKQIDYEWPSNDIKRLFPDYKQEDNLPLGLEVAGDRLFITVPRWRQGVAASLNYIRLNDTRESPPLIPYPSWEAHQYGAAGVPEIVSTFRVRADRCNRLWVLDTGLTDILGSPEQQAPPALIVYDLMTNRMLRKYVIPSEQRTTDSLFANIAVEDYSCEDSYGYLGDLGGPGLVVYSWNLRKSWLVKHHSFHPDPMGGEFKVSGISFQWNDGLFGMALAPTGDGYSTMYYHPLSSGMEFSVSTRLLRDAQRASVAEASRLFHVFVLETSHEFQTLGSRGPNGQSSVSFLDPKTGILFYALTNLNAIACWKPQNKFTVQQQGYVYQDNVTMVFPNDLKIDRNGNLWILSDRLPIFMYSQLDLHDYNFRILMGSTEQLIMGTVCDSTSPFTTTTIYDHRDHMDHMDHINNRIDHKDHTMSLTPRIGNSAGFIKIEIATMLHYYGTFYSFYHRIPFYYTDCKNRNIFCILYHMIYITLYTILLCLFHSNVYKTSPQFIMCILDACAMTTKTHIAQLGNNFLTNARNALKFYEKERAHHITDKAERLLPKFYVREAATPRSVPLTFLPDGFYRTFKRRAVEALKNVDFHKPSTTTNLIIDSLATTTFVLSLVAALVHSYAILILASLFLTWTTVAAHNYFHMRDNFRMYYFDLSMLSSKNWRITHAMSHHMYPNTIWDYEMYVVEPFLQWYPRKDKSYLTGMISKIISPFVWMLLFVVEGIKRYYLVYTEYGVFEFRDFVPFLLPISMSLVAPKIFIAFKLWFMMLLISSTMFGLIGFNAAHHHPDIFHDGDVYRNDLDWGLLEIDAVRDRKVIDDSIFLVMTNFGSHTLHHLLPIVDHHYLPLCVPAFLKTCEEFNVSSEKWTQWDLLKGQFNQLTRTDVKKNYRECSSSTK
ncbi:Protein yellow [Cyphomyrmex costatus]|uniref:Protein yellow n=1 Tax=Cyphomyrmex costatus TaxID=456900 RepID=A0A195CRS8_9HYME|nr:Protein yellow [Cyphomyrmex costatus]